MVVLENIIDSVVQITRHKEEYVLAESLVTTINQLLAVDVILLLEILFVETDDGVETRSSIVAAGGSEAIYNDDNVATIRSTARDVFNPLVEKCLDQQDKQVIENSAYSAYVLPVLNGAKIGYLLCVKHKTLSDTDICIIEGMTQVFANYLQILSEGKHDTLTGLLNRRVFLEKVNRIIQFSHSDASIEENDRRQLHTGEKYWLGIFDIDHFKRVNDTYGHLYGDEVLIMVGALMRECFRAGDLLFRYGGEEFIAVIGPTQQAAAIMVFERFRLQISQKHFGQIDQVTLSIGLVEIHADDNPTTVVGHADQALYYAKEHGRNQLAVYSELVDAGKIVQPEAKSDIEMF